MRSKAPALAFPGWVFAFYILLHAGAFERAQTPRAIKITSYQQKKYRRPAEEQVDYSVQRAGLILEQVKLHEQP